MIRTNANEGGVREILENWIRAQMGLGGDEAAPQIRDVYNVKIGLTLEDDSFSTESDAGNANLTAGIVLHTFANIDRIPIMPI